MLQLVDIKKDYLAGSGQVHALKGVNLCFGKNEFVSVLGPSGCGKTTLLNIIGGLDKYTSGKLLIGGKSTEEFSDADWDAYRNRCIGFVFQTYNLIPHLSVFGNVELALSLSGVSPSERRAKAQAALEKVGLKDEIKKLPNQLSGGQMQRVAIARAIVNDPEVILADEPTGALDSKTSEQIMELLKEISGDKLIIMVTHNEQLANQYSSRIIKLLDGEVVSDTASGKEGEAEQGKAKLKRTSMPFSTAFGISVKNLFTKKGRTFMTSFAASIGIIGIALVLAISNGFNRYIGRLQSETLASYPVTVSTTAMDMETIASEFQNMGQSEVLYPDEDKAAVYDPSRTILNMFSSNIITDEYVEYVNKLKTMKKSNGQNVCNDVQYSYEAQMHIFNSAKRPINNAMASMAEMLGMGGGSVAEELIDNEEFILSQYDVIYGEYPSAPENGVHKIALVVDKYNRLTTMMLSSLGLDSTDENGAVVKSVDYEELLGLKFKVLSNDAYFIEHTDEDGKKWFETVKTAKQRSEAYDNPKNIELEIVGLLRIKDSAPLSLYSSELLYLPSLTKAFLDDCANSAIGKAQAESQTECFVPGTYDGVEYGTNENPRVPIQTLMKAANNPYATELSKEQALEYAKQLAGVSSVPSVIYIYPTDFDGKKIINDYLDKWNEDEDGKQKPLSEQIKYTDAAAVLSSTLGQMVDIISYVLIAFACVSLVVSSIMIGIITYASVIERTKEIGVLRSIGARKKDIARMFNSETILIGLAAGIIGILASYILCVPINAIISSLAGAAISGSLAVLNPLHAIILVVISMCLTLIGGLVPAMIAAKKDPVVALRTE